METKIYSTDDQLMWLAGSMNDCTCGNTTISMDWGNVEIQCFAGSAPSMELKNRLVDLANDYMRLKKKELEEKEKTKKLMYDRGYRDGREGLNMNSTSAEYHMGYKEGRQLRIEKALAYQE
jgi:hypothetical protein